MRNESCSTIYKKKKIKMVILIWKRTVGNAKRHSFNNVKSKYIKYGTYTKNVLK